MTFLTCTLLRDRTRTISKNFSNSLVSKEILRIARSSLTGFGTTGVKVVIKWNESSRYEEPTQAMAEEMVRAVSDDEEGVLKWLKRNW